MAEYIDRKKIMLKTCSNCTRQINLVCKHDEPCEKLIAAFLMEDSVEAAPSVHGKWIEKTYETTSARGRKIKNTKNFCSVCQESNGRNKPDYCPRCGAKMDL